MSKVAKVVETVAPKSWRDTLIRTLKTAVAAGVSSILAAGLLNVADWKAALTAAFTTGLTFLLNAILVWANS